MLQGLEVQVQVQVPKGDEPEMMRWKKKGQQGQ